MQYLKPKFSIPASTGKVTQEEWDRIFEDYNPPVTAPDPIEPFPVGMELIDRVLQEEGWKSDGAMIPHTPDFK